MKKITVCLFILVIASAAYAAGKPPKCTDIPISWTFENTTTSAYASAITGDGNGAYADGSDTPAVIHLNSDCNGSRDATLNLLRAARSVNIRFDAINGTDIDGPFPAFAGQTKSVKPFFNVRNILAYRYSVGTTFYTKMSVSGFKVSSNRSDYNVAFLPFDGQNCPDPSGLTCIDSITYDGAGSNQNDPEPAAWVKVTFIAASGGSPDQWIVEGEFSDPEIQRGTLFSSGIHSGQFSMPFRIRITALAPLP